MATKYYNISGKCAWAQHLFQPDNSQYGERWSVQLYPDAEGAAVFKEAGISLQPVKKPTFEGEVGYTLRRDCSKLIKGTVQKFDPPFVKKVDGSPVTERIGNGSKVIANVAVYDTRGGMGPKGHRLQGITVVDIVPYNPPAEEITKVGVNTNVSRKVETPW